MTDIMPMQQEDFRGKYTRSGPIGRYLVHRFFDTIAELVKASGLRDGVALEVGAGEGYSTQRIHGLLPPGMCFEASEYRRDLAAIAGDRNPGIPVSVESVNALPRGPESIDLVLCLEVLEHLSNPAGALQELARISKGFVIISVPREPVWRMLNLARGKYVSGLGNTPGHIQHWSARGIKMFVSPWFNVVQSRTPLPWTILLLQKKVYAPPSINMHDSYGHRES